MMEERIMCDECMKIFSFNVTDDYGEFRQDDPLHVVECPYCGEKLAISYYLSVKWQSHRADNEDLENLEIEKC